MVTYWLDGKTAKELDSKSVPAEVAKERELGSSLPGQLDVRDL